MLSQMGRLLGLDVFEKLLQVLLDLVLFLMVDGLLKALRYVAPKGTLLSHEFLDLLIKLDALCGLALVCAELLPALGLRSLCRDNHS